MLQINSESKTLSRRAQKATFEGSSAIAAIGPSPKTLGSPCPPVDLFVAATTGLGQAPLVVWSLRAGGIASNAWQSIRVALEKAAAPLPN